MSKRKIFINISDVAAFIGQNKWDVVTPFERLWKKCDSDSYEKILQDVSIEVETKRAQSNVIEQEIKNLEDDLTSKKITKRQYTIKNTKLQEKQQQLQCEIETKSERVDDIKLSQAQKLEKAVGNKIIQQMTSNDMETADKRKVLDNAIESLNLSKEKLHDMKQQSVSFINKTHGTLKEDSAIQMFENKFNVKLDTSQQFNKLQLKSASSNSVFDWYICGKVDGLYIDPNDTSKNYIVEVKNRTKSFFNSIRDYEKTQIHLYMHMLSIPKAKLVEKLDNKIRITEIYEDTTYTTNILDYLGVFITSFETNFLDKPNVKSSYISKTNDDKKYYIHQKFLNPVLNFMNERLNAVIDEQEECMIDDLD
jgi:hypothetical protein